MQPVRRIRLNHPSHSMCRRAMLLTALVASLLIALLVGSTAPPQPARAATPFPSDSPVITAGNAAQLAQVGRVGRGWIGGLVWLADGETLAMAGAYGVWLHKPGSDPVLLDTPAEITSLDLSPDGKTIAAGGRDGKIYLLDVAQRSIRSTLEGIDEIASIVSVQFSPDGRLVAASARATKPAISMRVLIWELPATKPKTVFNSRAGTLDVAFNGSVLAFQDVVNQVVLLDLATNTRLGILDDDAATITAGSGIGSIAFSPDGKTAALGHDSSGKIVLWDMDTLSIRLVIESGGQFSYAKGVLALAFSPDGKQVASLQAAEGRADIWDAASGELRLTIDGAQGVPQGLAFDRSGSGNRLAVRSGSNQVKIIDLTVPRTEATLIGYNNFLFAAAYPLATLGTRVLAFAAPNNFQIHDLSNGDWWEWVGPETLLSHAISQDGSLLAAGTSDGKVYIWDLPGGGQRYVLDADGNVLDLAFSPNGLRLAALNSVNNVSLWDMQTGEKTRTLRGTESNFSGRTARVRFSADGSRVAGMGQVRYGTYAVWLWDANNGRRLNLWTGLGLAMHGDELVFLAGDGSLRVRNIRSGRETRLRAGLGRQAWEVPLTLSADGRVLAIQPNTSDQIAAQVWDIVRARQLPAPPCQHNWATKMLYNTLRYTVALSADGSVLACADQQGDLLVWDTQQGKPILTLPSRDTLQAVQFSLDGRFLLTGGSDGSVKIWAVR